MSINRLQVKNFKSFKDLDIELGNLNIIIGANASGKSNFINIFRFLRDISASGLNNAVQLQGGIEYLRNIKLTNKEEIKFSIDASSRFKSYTVKKTSTDEFIGISTSKINYKLDLLIDKQRMDFSIDNDEILQEIEIVSFEDNQTNEKKFLGKDNVSLSSDKGQINFKSEHPKILNYDINDFFPFKFIESFITEKTTLLEHPYLSFLTHNFFDNKIFDFDTKLLKNPAKSTGKAELEEDGSNLSIVLKNIISNGEKKRKFSNLIKYLLPFVNDFKIENTSDKSLLLRIQETYYENEFLPASFLSDGTIYITALIIALYFEGKGLTIIEEPEKNIHPSLISGLMEMMKDASKNKQIIITTHNPEIVKHADPNDIYLISRDKEGFSKIVKPKDSKTVQTFLDNDMTLDELYVDNLLEA